MKIEDFDYELPEELIAQKPSERRDDARLLVVHRDTGQTEHKRFYDILDYLKEGDCLVMNDSKVIPARLFGVKENTGAKVEFLLIKRKEGNYGQTGEKTQTWGCSDFFRGTFDEGEYKRLRRRWHENSRI